jgi:predicted amidohydrolase
MIITFSILQLNCLLGQYDKNFENAQQYLLNLPEAEKHLVILPELWTSGFTENLDQAVVANREIMSRLQVIAQEKNLLIAGSYIIKEDEDFYNQLAFIGPDGQVATYNKNNLFPQLNEFINFKPGNKLSILHIWNIKIGMAVCYDLRFPEIFRSYATNKVEICVLPAQWPQKRIDHFNVLLHARAIENQMIMASANICGYINKTKFGGNSSIIDHLGITQTNLEYRQVFSSSQIDINNIYKWRNEFPVLENIHRQSINEIENFFIDV